MPRAKVSFSSALEDCLNAIGQGLTIGDCLARHPAHADKLRPYLEAVIQMRQSSQSERQIPVDIPADIPFKVALNHSIQMIMRGKSPEHCYSQYPEHAAQLKPWLDAVVDVRENGGNGTVKELEFPRELLTPQVTYTEALEYCLDALERGIQPEVALSRYPYYADRLRIWVYYMSTLRMRLNLGLRANPPIPNRTARTVLPARVRKYSYQFSNFALSLLLTIFFMLGGTGLVEASRESLPGDSLYGLKRTVQQVQIGMMPAPQQQQAIALVERERRFEVSLLIQNKKEASVEFTGQVIAVNENSFVIQDVGTVYAKPGEKLPALQTGVVVVIKGNTNKNGVSAEKVDLVDSPGPAPVPPASTSVTAVPTATRTSLPTSTSTRWFSPTPTQRLFTPTWTNSPTPRASETFTSSPTNTPSNTPTNTLTSTPTFTLTFTPTLTHTSTFTATWTATMTPSPTFTNTSTSLPTSTFTSVPTDTSTPRPTNTNTNTPTPVPTDTSTPRPTNTPTPVPTDTSTPRPTNTPTPLPTSTFTPVPINSPTPTPDPEFFP
jgi:hypothetical protein